MRRKGVVWRPCALCVAVLVPPPAPQVGFYFGIELACVTSLASKKTLSLLSLCRAVCIARCHGAAGNKRFPRVMVCAAGGWQGWGWLLAPGCEPVRQVPQLLSVLGGTIPLAAATGSRCCAGASGSRRTGWVNAVGSFLSLLWGKVALLGMRLCLVGICS